MEVIIFGNATALKNITIFGEKKHTCGSDYFRKCYIIKSIIIFAKKPPFCLIDDH